MEYVKIAYVNAIIPEGNSRADNELHNRNNMNKLISTLSEVNEKIHLSQTRIFK